MGDQDEGCRCSVVTARTWLIVFNSVFVILGLAVAGAGGLVLWGKELVSSYLSDMLQKIEVDGESLDDILRTVAIVMMLVGILLLALGLMGCCGGCCLIRCCLLIYSLVMIKLLVAEITAVIVWFVMRSMIEDRVKGAMQTAIDTFYAGDTGTDVVSLGFNFLFTQLDCCGVDNYTDLYSASNWNRTYSAGGSTYNLVTPVMCCQLSGNFPAITIPNDVSCAVTPNATSSNYDTPCYEAFFDYLSTYYVIFIVIGVCLVVCEICSAVSAIILKKEAARKDKEVDSVPQSTRR